MIHRLHCSSHAINFHFHLLSRCPCPCPCPCQTISQSVTRHSQFIWALSSKSHHYISSLPIPTKTSLCPTKPTLSRLSLCVTIDPSSPPSLILLPDYTQDKTLEPCFQFISQTTTSARNRHVAPISTTTRVTPTAFDWISHTLNPPPIRRLANEHTHQ